MENALQWVEITEEPGFTARACSGCEFYMDNPEDFGCEDVPPHCMAPEDEPCHFVDEETDADVYGILVDVSSHTVVPKLTQAEQDLHDRLWVAHRRNKLLEVVAIGCDAIGYDIEMSRGLLLVWRDELQANIQTIDAIVSTLPEGVK